MFLKFTDQNLSLNWRQWHVLVFNLGIQIRNEPAEALHIPYYTGQFFFFNWPFKPQYPHTNSPNWSQYISLKNTLREFHKKSRHFLFGDHFINSHNLISWQCMDIVRRKFMFVTIGLTKTHQGSFGIGHRFSCSWMTCTSSFSLIHNVLAFSFLRSQCHYLNTFLLRKQCTTVRLKRSKRTIECSRETLLKEI